MGEARRRRQTRFEARVNVDSHPIGQSLVSSAPSFEVASIKTTNGAQQSAAQNPQPGGRVTLTNRTLRFLVQFAYSLFESPLHDLQIAGGPDWVDRDRFDITASCLAIRRQETANLARLMWRTLLGERFQLKVHTESRQLPVYALVLARSDGTLGPGLRRRADNCRDRRRETAVGGLAGFSEIL